ncbi:MAG: hypothetical protein LBJ04_04140 [Sphingobacterium sp.]|jgi:uncharacterized membrane protein|nr:hypothetical protein [Sphingobacterium sp.]
MYQLFKALRPILWLLHLAVVLLAVYAVITLLEGATFWGSAGLEEQLRRGLFLAAGYGLLGLGTDWLIHYRIPRLSQLKASRRALLIYLWRSYLIPLLPCLLLPMGYGTLWHPPVSPVEKLTALLLLSLLLLCLFSLVNQLALARHFLATNARAVAIARLRLAKVEGDEAVAAEGNCHGLEGYIAFCRQENRVLAYDEQGQTVLLGFRSLSKVKLALRGDKRFFMKGGWILRFDALDRQELIPETRAKKLYLKHTSNYFVLNKNDVSAFADWLKEVGTSGNPRLN